ncbi:hypothetical protein AcV5_005729 [Taiwanofungus camphoratus]|nr:hypothetical protein AcV5_005729 [Antrodia cinnamomea]
MSNDHAFAKAATVNLASIDSSHRIVQEFCKADEANARHRNLRLDKLKIYEQHAFSVGGHTLATSKFLIRIETIGTARHTPQRLGYSARRWPFDGWRALTYIGWLLQAPSCWPLTTSFSRLSGDPRGWSAIWNICLEQKLVSLSFDEASCYLWALSTVSRTSHSILPTDLLPESQDAILERLFAFFDTERERSRRIVYFIELMKRRT